MLSKKLEKILCNLISDDKETFNISAQECDITDIEKLIEEGYFLIVEDVSTMSGREYMVRPSYKALNYKKEKRKYYKEKAIEYGKYAITTAIAIAGLIIAVLAYLKE